MKTKLKTQNLLKKSLRKTYFQRIFSMYLDSSSIEAEIYYLLDSSLIDRDFVLDRSSIDQASLINKNQQHKKVHNLFVWNLYWDSFELVFKGHYKPSIRMFFGERNTSFIWLGFCNQVFSISPNQRVSK